MRKLILQDLKRQSLEEFKTSAKKPLIVIIDNLRSLLNVGSIFRSADAFAIKEIHIIGISGKPPHRDIQKTALGSTDSVEWRYFAKVIDSIEYCKINNILLLPFEQTSESISIYDVEVNKNFTYALVIGNEVNGVDMQYINTAYKVVEIPQYGTKHSLNVSVAAAIGMFHLTGKMK